MWKSLNHIIHVKKHSISNSNLKTYNFNSCFANVGKSLADLIDKHDLIWHLPSSIHDLNIQTINSNFVLSEILIFKDKSNLDVINKDARLLKLAAHVICHSVIQIINICIKHGILPADWKLLKVTPIYKNKGSKDDCGNYRPISVICHVARVMKKINTNTVKGIFVEA